MCGTFEEPPTGLIPCFSKTEGNTYATIAASPFPLQGKPTQAQDVAHGNISRDGYGNAIIGRYGGCFEEGIWYRRNLRGTRDASNGGRLRVHIIHGPNISHKELIYLLQKSTSYQSKVLRACS